jgi:hypothetical protein
MPVHNTILPPASIGWPILQQVDGVKDLVVAGS